MNLDEAIKHCEEVAEYGNTCNDCANDHFQLAKWLSELKELRNDFEPRYSSYPVESVDDGSFLNIVEQVNGLIFTPFQDEDCRIFLKINSSFHGYGHLEVTYINVGGDAVTIVPSFPSSCLVMGEISNYISEIVNRLYIDVKFVFDDGYVFRIPKFKNISELKMKLSLIGEQ